jgi:hypothetical protein
MSASPFVLLGVAVALATGGGCGGKSEESKANDDVCSAKADIEKQVASLQGMTASTFTVDAVTSDLKAIQTDVTKIGDAIPKLADDRKQQVQAANDSFKTEVNTVASTVLRSLSASDAQAQLQTAVSGLAAAYKTAFAKIDCSS